MQAKKEHFRSDIAILRGFSIALVILCHFEFKGFSFGFIGVDIFFVISGFLISQSLYREFLTLDEFGDNSRTISLATFYAKRIRRLLPAALTVILIVNFISYFFYNSETRERLASDSKWAFIFLANVAFLKSQSNYFQMGSQPSFLEHYWSLSVEEQFYAIWPLLFLFTATFKKFKIRKRKIRFNTRLLVVFVIVCISSYLFLQLGFTSSPFQVYFSLFSRAWELAVGGLFGILAFQKKSGARFSKFERLSPFVISILLSACFINQGNWANLIIFPVVSTGFFLYSGNVLVDKQEFAIEKKSKLFYFCLHLGAISYSLYLVHWPIYVIATRANLAENYFSKIALIGLSVLCAQYLWKYIEQPFQRIPISKKLRRDVEVFNYLTTRRNIVNFMIVAILVSLFLISSPINTFTLSNQVSKSSSPDDNIKTFAFYESQLINPNTTNTLESSPSNTGINSQAGPVTTGGELSNLISENAKKLEASLVDIKLSEKEASNLKSIKEDRSKFELSRCAFQGESIPPPECSIKSRDDNARKVLIVGDSKMAMLAEPISNYFSSKAWQVDFDVMFGCVMSIRATNYDERTCSARVDWLLKQIKIVKYDLIVIAEYPRPASLQTIQNEFFKNLAASSSKVLILGQIGFVPNPLDCITKDFLLSLKCTVRTPGDISNVSLVNGRLTRLSSNNVVFVDSVPWYCIRDRCPQIVNGTFVWRDGVHLTNSFVRQITPIINATLDSIFDG